jgi:hypothetical protein
MYTFYEEVELGCQSWEENFQPHFFSFEVAQNQYGDYSLRSHVASWMNLAEQTASAGYILHLQDRPEILDSEEQENHGEELENTYAQVCTSSDQARLTEEQAEELRRQGKAPP